MAGSSSWSTKFTSITVKLLLRTVAGVAVLPFFNILLNRLLLLLFFRSTLRSVDGALRLEGLKLARIPDRAGHAVCFLSPCPTVITPSTLGNWYRVIFCSY